MVEHDSSVNGLEVGGVEMDSDEEREEEWGERGKQWQEKTMKRNKRVREEQDSRSESEDEGQNQTQGKREDKFIVIIRFNEKSQGSMKRTNPFLLTTTLTNKVGEIKYARILNDGNLLISCVDEKQMERALKIKEINKCKVENSSRVGARKGGGFTGVIRGVPLNVSIEEL